MQLMACRARVFQTCLFLLYYHPSPLHDLQPFVCDCNQNAKQAPLEAFCFSHFVVQTPPCMQPICHDIHLSITFSHAFLLLFPLPPSFALSFCILPPYSSLLLSPQASVEREQAHVGVGRNHSWISCVSLIGWEAGYCGWGGESGAGYFCLLHISPLSLILCYHGNGSSYTNIKLTVEGKYHRAHCIQGEGRVCLYMCMCVLSFCLRKRAI